MKERKGCDLGFDYYLSQVSRRLDYNTIMINAVTMGDIKVVSLCKFLGVPMPSDIEERVGNGAQRDFLKFCKSWREEKIDAAIGAVILNKQGYKKAAAIFESWSMMSIDKALSMAVCLGDVERVRLCIKWGATDVEHAIGECVNLRECNKIIALLLPLAKDHNKVAKEIMQMSNVANIKLCKKYGANEFDEIMCTAASVGKNKIVELCKKWGATNFSGALCCAAEGGNADTVKLCVNYGATNLNEAMCKAAYYGWKNVVEVLVSLGATDFDGAMIAAAEYLAANEEKCEPPWICIIELCIEWGASNVNKMLLCGAEKGHDEIVNLCVEWGADDLEGAMNLATRAGKKKTQKTLLSHVSGSVSIGEKTQSEESFASTQSNESDKDIKMREATEKGMIVEVGEYVKNKLLDPKKAIHFAARHGHAEIIEMCKKHGANNFCEALCFAIEGGHMKAANMCVRLGANNFDEALVIAARHNRCELFDMCVKWGAEDFEEAMYIAVEMNRFDIIKRCIDGLNGNAVKGQTPNGMIREHKRYYFEEVPLTEIESQNVEAVKKCQKLKLVRNFDSTMCTAAYRGYIETVKQCKTMGAADYENAMTHGAIGGHSNVMKLCKKWGGKDYDKAMRGGATGGHAHIVELCKKWGARDFNGTMVKAISSESFDVVELCKKMGADNFDEALIQAVEVGSCELVCLLAKWGARDFNGAMKKAISGNKLDAVKLCKKMGANNFDEMLILAVENENCVMVKMFVEWGAKNIDEALAKAMQEGCIEVMELCQELKASNSRKNKSKKVK